MSDHGWFWPVALVVFTVGLFAAAFYFEGAKEARFMAECLKERKQYECTAIWRAGNSDVTVVPIVVPGGR